MLKNIISFISITLLGSISTLAYTKNIDSRLEEQFLISSALMMANMVRNDAESGSIVAAPSHQNPDYFYHWVRDAALTVQAALDLYQKEGLAVSTKKQLQQFFIAHLKFNQKIQLTSLNAGGLGEPKFTADGAVYAFPWGRPQNDGPALRSLSFSKILAIATNEKWPNLDEIKKLLYAANLPANSLVKADLEFVAHRWRDLNFDLWEEVYGTHFYTLMTQRKALATGVDTANYYLDFEAAKFYDQQLKLINKELENFWSDEKNFILATRHTNSSKSHLDTAVLLAVLHASMDSHSFSILDDRVIATFVKLKEKFHEIYYINSNTKYGVAFGRYAEDTYDGYVTNSAGNPWVLSTAAAAEFLYRTVQLLAEESSIVITTLNKKFFTQKKSGPHALTLKAGQRISRDSPAFALIVRNLIQEGDRYMERILFHKNGDGSLSEQINRNSGSMQGAPNLTWSHASFLSAKMARDNAIRSVESIRRPL